MDSIDVPFYRQTMDFTCGSACIIMALSHFDSGFSLDRNSEIDLWREGSSILVLGMGRYGISFPFLSRGYNVEVLANLDNIEFLARIEKRLDGRGMEVFRSLYNERKDRVLKMGLVEKRIDKITLDSVRSTIRRGGIPILLTDASELDDDKAPHWVVVTGVRDGHFSLNNPLDASGGRELPESDFDRIAGFLGEEVLVSVFSQNGRKSV